MADPSTVSAPSSKVEITVLKATGLPKRGRLSGDDQFYVQVMLGEQTSRTKNKQRAMIGTDVAWNEALSFDADSEVPDSTLEVYGKSFNEKTYGFVGRAIVPSVNNSGDVQRIGVVKTYNLPLSDDNEQATSQLSAATLVISLCVQEHGDDLATILKQASDALDRVKGPKMLSLSEGASTAESAAASVGSILEKLGKVAEVMDSLAEIHPYAKAAWDILDLTRKVIQAQVKQDESVRDLFQQMDSLSTRIHAYVVDLSKISPRNIHKDEKAILGDVVSTSRACAKFLTDYAKRSFMKRAITSAFLGGANQKIQRFGSAFASLEKRFNEQVWDGTSLVTRQILEKITDGEVAGFIVRGASLFASDKRSCFTGTRMAIRKEITDWINRVDEDAPRVLLLTGMAGTGKSTIAYTIANECAQQGILGASFGFNRRAQPPPVPRMLFPHIAASLAAFYPAVKNGLAETPKKEIASGSNLEAQLRQLIVEPLKQSMQPTRTNPICVNVVDAVDEADDDGIQAKELVSLLADRCAELPSNIRILVTSRPEIYVVDMRPRASVWCIAMPDRSDLQTLADVGQFVRDQLKDLRDIDETACAKLAETSQGLFQWAAIACKEIVGAPLQMGSTPQQRYEMVVASGTGRDKIGLLDSLYNDVLRRACHPDTNPDGHQLMKNVVAVLFALMEPVTLDALAKLYNKLGLGEESDVDTTLPYLASLLDGISDRTRPVQPNHTSLRDFFLDPSRSGPSCVKDLLPATHNHVARSSLTIVSTSLPEDVCTLDFARVDDDDYVKSEADRAQRDMPPYLEYTVLYWVKHLAEAPALEEAFWIDMASSFLADDRALRWIEVFCLLVMSRSRYIYGLSPPELSGCIGQLAYITKRQGSSCPEHVQSAVELQSTIADADNHPPFSFAPIVGLYRLREKYSSVAWTVRLRHQPNDGPSVTVGSGFFLNLSGASHDILLTTAHNLTDADGQPHTDLVVDVPQQLPRLDGASKFTDTQYPVPPTDIRICAAFSQRRELETDWGAILLPRGTALNDGFKFHTQSRNPDVMAVGIYGIPSWFPHHLWPPGDESNNSVDSTSTDRTAHVTRFENPIGGAPAHALIGMELQVRGICNPTYGDGAYTRLATALVGELGSWVGLGRSNTRLRWLPPTPSNSDPGEADGAENVEHPRAVPNWNDLFLFVDQEQGSRLYLKRGSGSSFDVSLIDINSHSFSLGFGSELVEALDKDADDGGQLACVSASDLTDERGLTVWMYQHADEDQQALQETITVYPEYYYYFDVESTPITSSSHGDSELFKISIQPQGSEAKRGSTQCVYLNFTLEQ